jgi:hypothetical protein
MCTVTIIPTTDGGVRLVSSRDEQRTRPRALPPERRVLRAGIVAAWPTDPAGGGTWIAASSRGLCLTLLNVNLERMPEPTERTLSRGSIIPTLIDSITPAGVLERLQRSDLHRFMPFRLVAADATELADFRWDGQSFEAHAEELAPRCFVSSGLGDHLVAPRLELWRDWIADHGLSPEAQDAFHEHRWPDRPHLSVHMDREDARTVSVSTALADGTGGVTLAHRDDAGTHELLVAGVVVTRSAMFTPRASGESA